VKPANTMRVITSWIVLSSAGRIDGAAGAVGRHGEAIFNEGDSPAHQHHCHERNQLELEIPIPSNGHKQIRADEENDGSELGTESGRKGGRRTSKMFAVCCVRDYRTRLIEAR